MTQHSDNVERALAAVDKILNSKELGDQFIQTSINDDVLELYGNRAGLLKVAQAALKLASKATPGSHFNFDAASELDACEQALEIGFKLADWELS